MLRFVAICLLAATTLAASPATPPVDDDPVTRSAPDCPVLSLEVIFLCVNLSCEFGSRYNHEIAVIDWGDGTETWVDMGRGTDPHTYATVMAP